MCRVSVCVIEENHTPVMKSLLHLLDRHFKLHCISQPSFRWHILYRIMILFGIVYFTPCCIHTHTRAHTHTHTHRLHCLGWEAPLSLWYFALLLVANENQISSKHESTVSQIEPRLSIWKSVWAHMSKRTAPVWSYRHTHAHTDYTHTHLVHTYTSIQSPPRAAELPSSLGSLIREGY